MGLFVMCKVLKKNLALKNIYYMLRGNLFCVIKRDAKPKNRTTKPVFITEET